MPSTTERTKLIGIRDAADYADVSIKTVRRRIADGTLPAYRVGRLIKVDPADLDRLAVRIPAGAEYAAQAAAAETELNGGEVA